VGAAVSALGDPGEPVPADVRRQVERTVGTGLSHVRIHRGPGVDAAAAGIGATAFTWGGDIGVRRSAYRPDTLPGRALLAHELVHAAQQTDAGPATDVAAAVIGHEAQANALAARSFLGAPGAPERTGLRLARCTGEPDADWSPDLDRDRYTAVVLELHELWQRRRTATEAGTYTPEESSTDNERIDVLVAELRGMGIQLTREELYGRIFTRGEVRLLEYSTWLEQEPTGELHRGDPVVFRVRHQYLPPNLTAAAGPGYRFMVRARRGTLWSTWFDPNGNPFGSQFSGSESQELHGLFWQLASRADAIQMRVHVGIRADLAPPGYFAELDSPVLEVQAPSPRDLALSVEPAAPVAGQWWAARFASWWPDRNRHVVEWWVDGRYDRTAAPHSGPLRRDAPGRYEVVAKVWTSPGGGRKDAVFGESEPLAVKVWSGEELGRQQVALLTAQGLPGLGGLRSSMDESISRLEPLAGRPGQQQPYYEQQLANQRVRRTELDRHFPKATTFRDLPADPSTLERGRSYAGPVPATLVLHEHGRPVPLTMYLRAWYEGTTWRARLVDLTSREVRTYGGEGGSPNEAYRTAFANWEGTHDYPRGNTVAYAFGSPGLALPGHFDTSNSRNAVLSVIDWLMTIGGVIVAGVLLIAPDPSGITKGLGVLLLAASVARGMYGISDNISHGVHPLDSRNIIEAVGILASLAGLSGSALRSAGMAGARVARPALFRAGSWFVWTAVAGDAGTLVFATQQAYTQIRAIEADPSLDDHQRATRLVQLTAALLLQAAMVVVSNKDLKSQEFQASRLYRESLGHRSGVRINPEDRVDMEAVLRTAGDDPDRVRAMGELDLLRRHAELVESEAIGGTRGPAAYRTGQAGGASPNTLWRTVRDRFVSPSPDRQRMRGAFLQNIGTPAGEPPVSAGVLRVPLEAGGHDDVPVRIRAVYPVDQPSGPHGAGGAETGPATMRVTRMANGTYQADIAVRSDLHTGDIADAVGHELDELAGLVRGRFSGEALAAQQRAGLMRASRSQQPPTPTVHDEAQARELKQVWERMRRQQGADRSFADLRASGKLPAWGLEDTRHVERRVSFLREQGVPEELVQRLHVDMALRRHRAAHPTASLFDETLINHILYPSVGSSTSHVGGAHLHSSLEAHARANPDLLFVEIARDRGGGELYQSFAQCRWLGAGAPPPVGDPRRPVRVAAGQAGFPGVRVDPAHAALWNIAAEPKTTFRNAQAFMSEVESAWLAYITADPGLAGDNVPWHETSAGESASAGGSAAIRRPDTRSARSTLMGYGSRPQPLRRRHRCEPATGPGAGDRGSLARGARADRQRCGGVRRTARSARGDPDGPRGRRERAVPVRGRR